MCGIAGIIKPEGIVSEHIISMAAIIRHRGPDDEGYLLYIGNNDQVYVCGGADTPESVWATKLCYTPSSRIDNLSGMSAKVAFGHRRLSILDLSPAGHQPMSYMNGRYWIVYNGEIYNYEEIKIKLQSLGHKFISRTDTEVILAAYSVWGPECLNMFAGMWAFAILDTEKK